MAKSYGRVQQLTGKDRLDSLSKPSKIELLADYIEAEKNFLRARGRFQLAKEKGFKSRQEKENLKYEIRKAHALLHLAEVALDKA